MISVNEFLAGRRHLHEQDEYTEFDSFFDAHPRVGRTLVPVLSTLRRTEQDVQSITVDNQDVTVVLRMKQGTLRMEDSFLKSLVKTGVDSVVLNAKDSTISIRLTR